MDEFITNLTKMISDKSYAERVQLLDERKSKFVILLSDLPRCAVLIRVDCVI